MVQKVWRLLLAIGLWGSSGCDKIPSDPQHTLESVRGNVLDVGYSENPPWVVLGPEGPTGREPELIRAFAKTIDADIRWHRDTEQNLLQALEEKKLQVVVAGLTDDSPWGKQISFTRPYLEQEKKKRVMGVIMGENAFVTQLETFLHQREEELKNKYGHETPQ